MTVELPKGNGTGCGSIAGYVRHKRSGEASCIQCKAAWREYYKAYRALGRKAKKDGAK